MENDKYQEFIPCEWCGKKSVVWTWDGTLSDNCFNYLKMQEEDKKKRWQKK